jgi:hypothetical protein
MSRWVSVTVLSVFLFAGQAKSLAALPQAFAADAQFFGQLGFIHLVLMFKDKLLEIVFER